MKLSLIHFFEELINQKRGRGALLGIDLMTNLLE